MAQTLQALYPQADSVRWKREEEGYYEGHFQLDRLPHKIRVEPDGRWRETEIELARPALPVPLQDSLDRLLDLPPRTRRIRATSIIHFADGHISYEVQVRQPDNKWYRRLYDAHGRTLREKRIKRG